MTHLHVENTKNLQMHSQIPKPNPSPVHRFITLGHNTFCRDVPRSALWQPPSGRHREGPKGRRCISMQSRG